MDRTTGSNHVVVGGKRQFTDGPPGTAIEGSHMTAVQEEIMSVIEHAGIAPSSNVFTQLLSAIQNIVAVESLGHLRVRRTAIDTTFNSVSDTMILVDTSGGNRIITGPALADVLPGRLIYIKKKGADANTVTFTPQGGALIDGEADATITLDNEVLPIAVNEDATAFEILK